MPRLVHHPHAPATDLGQDVVVPDLLGGRSGFQVSLSRGVRVVPVTQRANRRATLVRADQPLVPAGRALPQPGQQGILRGQLIDAAATGRTVVEMGQDAGQVRLRERAQGQRPQFFDSQMVRRVLGHGTPVCGSWAEGRRRPQE
jgi:hypothetical protein